MDHHTSSADLPLVLEALAATPLHTQAQETVSQVLHPFQRPVQPSALAAHFAFIENHFTRHSVEEIIAALEKEPTAWHQETVALLRKKSPTSLKVTLRQLHEGLKRDFAQCMQLEYHLMCHFTQSHDLYEGIRAILIEKTQNPQWQPAELNEISQETVEAYFLPLPGEEAQLLFT
jgi:enoyl-CoA hydratase